jgi:hypothetical protein
MGIRQNLYEKKNGKCCCQWTLSNDITDHVDGTKWKCTKWCECEKGNKSSQPDSKNISFSDSGNTAVTTPKSR